MGYMDKCEATDALCTVIFITQQTRPHSTRLTAALQTQFMVMLVVQIYHKEKDPNYDWEAENFFSGKKNQFNCIASVHTKCHLLVLYKEKSNA